MCTINCMNYRFFTTAQCYCSTNLYGTSHVHTARVLGFKFLRFEILTAVFLEIQVFRDVTQGCRKINALTFWRIIIPSPWEWSSPQTLTNWQCMCYDPLKLLELLVQWESVVSQKSSIFNPICYTPIIMPQILRCNSNHTALQIKPKYPYRPNVIFYLTW